MDYPRPPRLETFDGSITIELGGRLIATTNHGWRVLETSHPPTYYPPRTAFADGVLRDAPGSSWCEVEGAGALLRPGDRCGRRAEGGLDLPASHPGFEPIAGAIAVMAGQVDRCTVNGETVVPQPGGFYGGWITSWVVGPFKGIPGSMGW